MDVPEQFAEQWPSLVVVMPGSEATAGAFGDEPGTEHLVLLADPFNLALTLPSDPVKWVSTARFLRELAHSAALMADRIDPDGLGQATWAPLHGAARLE